MQLRRLLFVFTCGVLLAACSANTEVTASGAADGDAELAQALELALTDCFDPLHDSDGSGGFFEFCARADAAQAAEQLDCVRTSGDAIEDPTCQEWTFTRAQIPPQYFDADVTPSAAPAPAQEPRPAEDAVATLADRTVLEWIEFGGCAWGGDLCRSYTVFGDGRVQGSRGGEVLATGSVDPALVQAVFDAGEVDADALLASLGAGPCQAAVDGISHEVWIAPADLRINSCDFDISGDEPLVAAARVLGQAAEAAAVIE